MKNLIVATLAVIFVIYLGYLGMQHKHSIGPFLMFVPIGLVAVAVLLFLRLPALTNGHADSAEPPRSLAEIVVTQRRQRPDLIGTDFCLR